MPQNEIENLLKMCDEAYSRAAWHGPNLRGSLSGITARSASQRPGPGRHNIWEIVVHAAYWKYAVRRRLLGEKRGSFSLEGSNWFARPASRAARAINEKAWRSDVLLLDKEHRQLTAAIARFAPDNLDLRLKGSKSVARRLITGIAFHDVYHAGQIQLLKKLLKSSR